jgi:hypothetical protein
MRKSRSTEEQIVGILKESEAYIFADCSTMNFSLAVTRRTIHFLIAPP